MKDFSEIDKNFKVDTTLFKEGIRFYSVLEKPFSVFGVFYDNGKFRRLPQSVAETVNEGVAALHANTAGGRVRFLTDSPYVAIHAEFDGVGKMPHFALSGSVGFDLYERKNGEEVYIKTFIPPFETENSYDSLIGLTENGLHEITINFPLYSDVSGLYIGLDENAVLRETSEPYRNEKPVVFYGSSITQGGCASRPGSAYEAILSRRFHLDYINLGFSGSARGEESIAEYIKELPMSLFVYDYDHNAPTKEHLLKTHERMFRMIREKKPALPILILSRPAVFLSEEEKFRLEIIRTTYQNAVAKGDNNVYFIEGADLMKYCGNEGTVDFCHPTDFGFHSMAKVIGDFLETYQLV